MCLRELQSSRTRKRASSATPRSMPLRARSRRGLSRVTPWDFNACSGQISPTMWFGTSPEPPWRRRTPLNLSRQPERVRTGPHHEIFDGRGYGLHRTGRALWPFRCALAFITVGSGLATGGMASPASTLQSSSSCALCHHISAWLSQWCLCCRSNVARCRQIISRARYSMIFFTDTSLLTLPLLHYCTPHIRRLSRSLDVDAAVKAINDPRRQRMVARATEPPTLKRPSGLSAKSGSDPAIIGTIISHPSVCRTSSRWS